MNRNYVYLTILMLVLAGGTLFLNPAHEPGQLAPEKLLQYIVQPSRFVSTDQVAKLMINGDPSLLLVDVRTSDEYEDYSLPGAINIPMENLLEEDNLSYFGNPGVKVVLYSNDDIFADQSWVLLKRLGFSDIYVMKGGLNTWMETIIDPVEPSADAPADEHALYAFRKGAQMFFTGAQADVDNGTKVKVNVKRREKATVAAGGC